MPGCGKRGQAESACRNRSFFVRDFASDRPLALMDRVIAAPEKIVKKPIDAAVLIRGMLHQGNDKPQPGMG